MLRRYFVHHAVSVGSAVQSCSINISGAIDDWAADWEPALSLVAKMEERVLLPDAVHLLHSVKRAAAVAVVVARPSSAPGSRAPENGRVLYGNPGQGLGCSLPTRKTITRPSHQTH